MSAFKAARNLARLHGCDLVRPHPKSEAGKDRWWLLTLGDRASFAGGDYFDEAEWINRILEAAADLKNGAGWPRDRE